MLMKFGEVEGGIWQKLPESRRRERDQDRVTVVAIGLLLIVG